MPDPKDHLAGTQLVLGQWPDTASHTVRTVATREADLAIVFLRIVEETLVYRRRHESLTIERPAAETTAAPALMSKLFRNWIFLASPARAGRSPVRRWSSRHRS